VLSGKGFSVRYCLPARGLRTYFRDSFSHPEIRRIFSLMLPRLFGSGIYQLNNFVDSIFGSFAAIVGDGGVAVLYYAYRVIQFPVGIFSNSLAQVLLPTLTGQSLRSDYSDLRATFSSGVRLVFFVLVPTSVVLCVLSRPLVLTLFEGGQFDMYAGRATAQVLFCYSIGLAAYGGIKVVNSCFFALKDTLTPAKVSVLTLVMNIALNALLMVPLKLQGLALATSVSSVITFCVSLRLLHRRIGGTVGEELLRSFARIAIASTCAGAACFLASRSLVFVRGDVWQNAVRLVALVGLSALTYLVACGVLGVRELRECMRLWPLRRPPQAL
jgi:putative peptidoglycan lipid II flippase